jgi:hypothetical protein
MPAKTEKDEPGQIPCQGVSRWDEPCMQVGTRHCERCELWFCAGHFSDPDWHPCEAGSSPTS